MTTIPQIFLRAQLLHPNCLNVHKFANPVFGQFASMAGILYSTEGQARIGRHHFVEKDHAGVELIDESLGLRRIVRPGAGAQSETNVVRDVDRLIDILHAKN